MWIDAHLHLDAPPFDSDRAAIIARATAAGVHLLVSAGTSVEGSRGVISLAERYSSVVAAVGIHPEAADSATGAALDELTALARHPRVVAVGEVGLDYYRDRVPRPVQREAFRAQIRLARAAGLPLVVHDRDAHEDVEHILRDEGVARVILHCFSGTPEMALRCAATGWTISMAGPLTFAKSSGLREVAACVPLDRMLVETDAPYLSPEPLRGRRCEPAFLIHTAHALATIREMDDEALAAALVQNARRVFGLSDDLVSGVPVQ
jgi:TatD DNase family protein